MFLVNFLEKFIFSFVLKFCADYKSLMIVPSSIVASLEADASALSSVASSQDSLHKQPKKKGIKSSIGRLFGKKEKGRLAHLAHRQVMVDPQGVFVGKTKTI